MSLKVPMHSLVNFFSGSTPFAFEDSEAKLAVPRLDVEATCGSRRDVLPAGVGREHERDDSSDDPATDLGTTAGWAYGLLPAGGEG